MLHSFHPVAIRTPSDRGVFQNRQESVDRFGSLLRDYQVSKKGLQQYPERAVQDLRYASEFPRQSSMSRRFQTDEGLSPVRINERTLIA